MNQLLTIKKMKELQLPKGQIVCEIISAAMKLNKMITLENVYQADKEIGAELEKALTQLNLKHIIL